MDHVSSALASVLFTIGILSLHLLHLVAHLARMVLSLPERLHPCLPVLRRPPTSAHASSRHHKPTLRHLAVAWTNHSSLYSRCRGQAYSQRVLSEDIARLAAWCKEGGIGRLSIYDEDDHLKESLTSPPINDDQLQVLVLSRADAHASLAHVAASMADTTSEGLSDFEGLTVSELRSAIAPSSSLGDDPDLLIVLGGRTLRLHGYPPWQIRLTEIAHAPSYSILPSRISASILCRATLAYSRSQQRWGR